VQHVGAHAVLQGYRGNGCTRLVTGSNQFALELACVVSVGLRSRMSRKVCHFEYGVRGGLRAHDVARCKRPIQDGFTALLQQSGQSG
jgi:hypothetical protein